MLQKKNEELENVCKDLQDRLVGEKKKATRKQQFEDVFRVDGAVFTDIGDERVNEAVAQSVKDKLDDLGSSYDVSYERNEVMGGIVVRAEVAAFAGHY